MLKPYFLVLSLPQNSLVWTSLAHVMSKGPKDQGEPLPSSVLSLVASFEIPEVCEPEPEEEESDDSDSESDECEGVRGGMSNSKFFHKQKAYKKTC